jgi:RsiW-degrading membrane proteinase PrsW (M82 family)
MSKWSVKRKLIVVEIAYYISDAILLYFYWRYPFSAYTLVGLILSGQFFVSIVSTYYWFQRTD